MQRFPTHLHMNIKFFLPFVFNTSAIYIVPLHTDNYLRKYTTYQ